MALATLHWFSSILEKATTAQVLLPDGGEPPFATLYLLHGASDDSTSWLRNTRLEHYARRWPLLIVMPDGYRGYYTDNESGPAYAQHIGLELPDVIERHFQARPDRTSRAIGGLSMGGYGALRVGLGYSDRFCSVHTHSAAVWQRKTYYDRARQGGPAYEQARRSEIARNFGRLPVRGSHDLLVHARRARKAGSLPAIQMDCGAKDFLLPDNRVFHATLTKARIPHDYQEFAGSHCWDYWDKRIRRALAFHARHLGLSK